MKHKGIYRIVPFLLAVLLISSGLVLPRLMIKRLKTQLLQVSGNVRTESLALYGYDEINAQVLAGRMKGLSEMTALLAAGEDTSDALLIATREPLDTELTQENAISAAQSFLNDMQTVFAEYGYSFLTTVLPTLPAVQKRRQLNMNIPERVFSCHPPMRRFPFGG